MGKRISSQTRKELLDGMQRRYRESSKMDKARILDEFIALTGYHRKHGVRLLRQAYETEIQPVKDCLVRSRRVYEKAVKEALTVLWEVSDRLCGKRLKAILPEMVEAMERHGHLSLDPEVRNQVLRISAATLSANIR